MPTTASLCRRMMRATLKVRLLRRRSHHATVEDDDHRSLDRCQARLRASSTGRLRALAPDRRRSTRDLRALLPGCSDVRGIAQAAAYRAGAARIFAGKP